MVTLDGYLLILMGALLAGLMFSCGMVLGHVITRPVRIHTHKVKVYVIYRNARRKPAQSTASEVGKANK